MSQQTRDISAFINILKDEINTSCPPDQKLMALAVVGIISGLLTDVNRIANSIEILATPHPRTGQ